MAALALLHFDYVGFNFDCFFIPPYFLTDSYQVVNTVAVLE